MNMDEIKKRLDSIGQNNIVFTKHVETKIAVRGFKKDFVCKALIDTKNLNYIEEQKDENGLKYRLEIKLSNKYNFIAVVSFNAEKINVVTCYKESVKRVRGLKKWLERS